MKKLFIKNLFLVFLLVVLSAASSFAQRVLTDDERQTLRTSEVFKQKCEWAIRNYAAYWSVHDGSGLSTESDRIKWAKDRLFSVQILKTDITDQNVTLRFLNASKGKTFSGLPTAPASESALLGAWITAASYEEFAGKYFDLLGDDINFSIGN